MKTSHPTSQSANPMYNPLDIYGTLKGLGPVELILSYLNFWSELVRIIGLLVDPWEAQLGMSY